MTFIEKDRESVQVVARICSVSPLVSAAAKCFCSTCQCAIYTELCKPLLPSAI